MTLGLYIPRQSPIHQWPASVKLVGLAIAGIGVFFLSDLMGLFILLGIVVGLLGLAKLPVGAIAAQLRPLVVLLLIIFVIQGLSVNWESAGVTVLRFLTLVLLASLVSLTTRVSELLAVIEQTAQPLRHIGLSPAAVSLVFALTIRFIPVLLDQFQAIQEAQRARGLDRHMLALLVPFLVKTLHLADTLADALDARCYNSDPDA